MASHTYFEEYQLNYIKCTEPFRPEELHKLFETKYPTPEAAAVLGNPTFVDMRGVDTMVYSAEDFKRLINRRKAHGARSLNNAYATVVSCEGCLGMIRMFNIYADINGLRQEQNSFVTMDYDEAVAWLAERMETLSQESLARLLAEEAHPPAP